MHEHKAQSSDLTSFASTMTATTKPIVLLLVYVRRVNFPVTKIAPDALPWFATCRLSACMTTIKFNALIDLCESWYRNSLMSSN